MRQSLNVVVNFSIEYQKEYKFHDKFRCHDYYFWVFESRRKSKQYQIDDMRI